MVKIILENILSFNYKFVIYYFHIQHILRHTKMEETVKGTYREELTNSSYY